MEVLSQVRPMQVVGMPNSVQLPWKPGARCWTGPQSAENPSLEPQASELLTAHVESQATSRLAARADSRATLRRAAHAVAVGAVCEDDAPQAAGSHRVRRVGCSALLLDLFQRAA